MKIVVIDSGVHLGHPHIGQVCGGVAVAADGSIAEDIVDRLGHGTAVMAAIRDHLPDAEYYVVKLFNDQLRCSSRALLSALDWAIQRQPDFINLSLGTTNEVCTDLLKPMVRRAAARGTRVVSVFQNDGMLFAPGSIEGAVGVVADARMGRRQFQVSECEGRAVYLASPYPRPIFGVPAGRNLQGASFAVANLTGLLANSEAELAMCSEGPSRRQLQN